MDDTLSRLWLREDVKERSKMEERMKDKGGRAAAVKGGGGIADSIG